MADMIDVPGVRRDISDIGKSVNEDTVVEPRTGLKYDSLPKVSREAKQKMQLATQAIVAETEQNSNSFMNELSVRYLALSLKGNWITSTQYIVKDLVFVNNITYICLFAHTSSASFQNDLNAEKWFVYQGATQVDLQSYLPKTAEFSPVLGSPVRFKLNPIKASFLYGINDPTHLDDNLNIFRGLNNPNAWHDSNIPIGAVAFGRNNVPFAYLSMALGHDCIGYGVASLVMGAGSCTGNPDVPSDGANYGYCSLAVGKDTQARGRISNAMGERCLSEGMYSSTDGFQAIAGKRLSTQPDYDLYGADGAAGTSSRAHGYDVQAYGNFSFAYGALLRVYNGAQLIGKGSTSSGSYLQLSKRGLGFGYNVAKPTIFCKEGDGIDKNGASIGFNTSAPISRYDYRLNQSDTVTHVIESIDPNAAVAFVTKGLLGNGQLASLHNLVITHPNSGQAYGTATYYLNGNPYLSIDQTLKSKFYGAIETASGLMVAGKRVIGGQMSAIVDLPLSAPLEDVEPYRVCRRLFHLS